jgi:hypothetical protein
MRWLFMCLSFGWVLEAQQQPLHIMAIERKGLPPYESTDRVYCLDGGKDCGLRVGARLSVKRVGEARVCGHLWVTEVTSHQAGARYAPRDSTYPMKGDLATLDILKSMPEAGRLNPDPLPVVSSPSATPKAPPHEGVLFFLPQRAELSLAGVKKLEAWVQAWGREGQWSIQVPTAKAIKPALQKQRIESLEAALRALGIEQVKQETGARATESKYDPAWIRHWE